MTKPTNPRKAAIDADNYFSKWDKTIKSIPLNMKTREEKQKEYDASIIRAYLTNPPEEAVEEMAAFGWKHAADSGVFFRASKDWDSVHENSKETWKEWARALFKRLAEKKGE